jgi:phenylacetic acid degradation operon negative regulatory protein
VATPTARHLVLDLLSTLPRGAMPVRALVAAGALFAIRENSVRVALARLLADGLVERDERGAYRLGPRAQAVSRQVASWRNLDARLRPWNGGWIGVHTAGLRGAARSRLRRHRRALDWLGFRDLRAGLALRPDNLAEGVTGVRQRLGTLGLDLAAPVFVLHDLDAAADLAARRLWPVTRLVAGYRASRLALERSEHRLPALPEARGMVESFQLGGQAIRQLALDPLLPEELLPSGERGLLVETMRRYDRAGRTCWARFLERFGVVRHPNAPADLRLPAAMGGHW